MKRLTLVGIALGLLWLLAASPASADHRQYFAQKWNAGEDNLDRRYTGAMKGWVLDGDYVRFCLHGWGPGPYRDAVLSAVVDWRDHVSFPQEELANF